MALGNSTIFIFLVWPPCFLKKGHFTKFGLKFWLKLRGAGGARVSSEADDGILKCLVRDAGLWCLANVLLAVYFSASGFLAPKSFLLYKTHFKYHVPTHCAYIVLQTFNLIHIIIFIKSRQFFTWRFLVNCKDEIYSLHMIVFKFTFTYISPNYINKEINTHTSTYIPLKC